MKIESLQKHTAVNTSTPEHTRKGALLQRRAREQARQHGVGNELDRSLRCRERSRLGAGPAPTVKYSENGTDVEADGPAQFHFSAASMVEPEARPRIVRRAVDSNAVGSEFQSGLTCRPPLQSKSTHILYIFAN